MLVARPAIIPEAAPKTLGRPASNHSIATQDNVAPTAEKCVDENADVAKAPDPSALPALNPNHPTHSNPVPINDSTTLCGIICSDG